MILANVQYQWVGHVEPDRNWHIPLQRHPFHELILVVRGKLFVSSGSLRVSAEAGDAVIYPSGVSHAESTDPDDPLESLFLSFGAERLPYGAVTKGRDRHGHMLHAMRWLYADRDSQEAVCRDQRHAIAQAVLAEFMRPPEPTDGGLLARMREYMRSRIGETITLGQLAAHAGMSKFHFLRTYSRYARRTPMADLRALRAEYARELLVSTATPIKEIAEIAGLGSPYAMSRLFRRQFGMPPGQFRRSR
jgi:AraC-like DNA-binding protein